MIQGHGNSSDQIGYFGGRGLMLSAPTSQIDPFYEFGGQIKRRPLAPEFQKLHDPWMPESSRRSRFLMKALDRLGLRQAIGMQYFQGNVQLQRRIVGFVDDAEAARSQLGLDTIRA